MKTTTSLYLLNRFSVSVLFALMLFFLASNSWAVGVTGNYGYVEIDSGCNDPLDYQANLFKDGLYVASFGHNNGQQMVDNIYNYYPTDASSHYYEVKCLNYDNQTWWGASGNAAAFAPEPTSLSATQGTQTNRISLSWSVSTGATSYEIYRSSTSSQLGTLLATGPALSYSDTSISTSGYYYYTVIPKAYNVYGPYSNQQAGWRDMPAPTSLSATQGTIVNTVGLSWTPVTESSGYNVYRSDNFGQLGALIAQTTTPSYMDASSGYDTHYNYTVKGTYGAIIGNPSTQQVGWGKSGFPGQTTGVTATNGTLYGKVTINWTGAENATSYTLYRSVTSGSLGSQIASNITGTSYEDSSVSGSTHYFYTVVSVNSNGSGPNSSQVVGWGKIPSTISSLAASQGLLIGNVHLGWTADKDAASYEIWRSISSGSGYAFIGSSTNAYYDDSSAIDPTRYYYIVKAKIGAMTSNASNEATGWSRLPNAITTLTATNGELVAKVRLKWALDKDATNYEIWRAETPTGTPILLNTQQATSSSFEDVTGVASKNYYYTVRVKVNLLVGAASNVALGMASPIPPAPQITFKGGTVITTGKYYVPVGQNVTSLIPTSPAPLGETIKITITQNNQAYEKLNAFSNAIFPISAPNLGLLEERPIKIRVAWQNFPNVYNEQTITAVGGIKSNVKLTADAPTQVSDTETITIKLQVGEYTKDGIVYDAPTMGQWKTRIVAQTDKNPISTPVTDWVDMVDGKASFSINPAGNQFMKLTAISTLTTSVSGLNVKLDSSAKYVQVLKGTPIEGVITSKQFDAPAPKMFTLNLELTKDNRLALKSLSWEESTDNGATWTSIPESNTTRKNFSMPEPERKKVRVKMINKNSLVESYTAPVELFAYAKLVATITGPVNGAPGGNVNLSADIYKNGLKISNPVVEWTVPYVSGKQFSTGSTVTVNESEEGRLTVLMRARSPDTRADDINAWAYARYTVSFKNPLPPVLTVTGPREVETGKINSYTGSVRPSWGSLQSALSIISEWELPDGTIVPGKILDWNPTPASVSSLKPLIYRAWVDGFKETTISEKPITYKPWTYIWPEFTIAMKQLSVESPSDVSLIVNHKVPEMDRHFEGLKYVWTFPENVVGRQNDAFPNRTLANILYQGQHNIKVTISDDRGHETVLTQTVTTTEALPFSISMKISKSNIYDRAPMTITVRPSLSGGHPLDSVNKQTWKLDNTIIDSYNNRDFLFTAIPSPGEHVVSYTMLSKMGKEVIATKTLTLINNLPPTCELIVTNSTYSAYVDAKCKDPDGRVIAYAWKVDGRALGSTSYRISFSKTTAPQSASVSITATDDAGDLSVPVTISVNY